MSTEEPKLYTIKEIQHLFENLALPKDPQYSNEIEASLELTVKATFLLYQYIDHETGKGKRSFAVRFYHDDCNDIEPAFPSINYAAEIQDVNGENNDREIGFNEIAGLLQIDPEKAMWDLVVEPEE